MFDMIGNIFTNLFSKPATRKYPFEKRAAFHGSRGELKGIDIDACIFCGMCARKCPANVITVDRNKKLWEFDPYKCVICGECAAVCPKKCIMMDEHHRQPGLKKEMYTSVQPPQPPKDQEKASDSQAV